MRVYYDLNYLAKERFGGISRAWMEYFRCFPESTIEPIFFIVPANNSTADYLKENNYFNAPVFRENYYGKFDKIKRFGFYRSLKFTFFNKFKNGIFHSTDYFCPLIRREGLKIVTTIHDMVFFDEKNQFTKTIDYWDVVWSIKHALNISDFIIVPSESTKKSIIKHFPSVSQKLRVNYWGIHPSILNKKICRKKERYFLFIGGRNCYKNYDFLLEAFALFLKNKTGWKLHVVGENSSTRNDELSIYRSLGIEENIIDHGHVNQDKLTNITMWASAVIIQSLCEGFNFPLLEAMALGTHVLSSDISVSREIGKSYVDYFSPHSVQSLVSKMNEAVEHPMPYQNLFNAQVYAHTFSWEKSFARLINIYNECIDGGHT